MMARHERYIQEVELLSLDQVGRMSRGMISFEQEQTQEARLIASCSKVSRSWGGWSMHPVCPVTAIQYCSVTRLPPGENVQHLRVTRKVCHVKYHVCSASFALPLLLRHAFSVTYSATCSHDESDAHPREAYKDQRILWKSTERGISFLLSRPYGGAGSSHAAVRRSGLVPGFWVEPSNGKTTCTVGPRMRG